MKGLSYFISIFCVSIFVISCSQKRKNPAFDEDMIRLISENPIYSKNLNTLQFSNIIPPEYAFTTFFVQGDSDKILLLDPRELEEIYMEDYSSWKYKKFVKKALNQELIIKPKTKRKTFKLDKDVTDNYFKNDFSGFCKIYCEDGWESDIYHLRNDIQWNQVNSVFYYFFINNYLTWFDDPSGIYSISKTSIHTNHYFKEK